MQTLGFLQYARVLVCKYIGINIFSRANVTTVRMSLDNLTGRLQLNGLAASGIEPYCMDVGSCDTTLDEHNYGHHTEAKGG